MHPVPSAKTALKAILAARGAWASVEFLDGQPTKLEAVTRDMFWFGPTEVPEDDWSLIGAQGRRVTFLLGFTINVLRDSGDEGTTENLMWLLYEDLMAAIKANPTLSQTVQMVQRVNGRQANGAEPNLWNAVFTGSISCLSKAY